MAKLQLFYWNIRGLAEHIRMMLEYAGADWEDKYYECGPAPDFDTSCWFDVKFKLGLPFPNLPYVIHGDTKVTQSQAITHYVAKLCKLEGKNPEEVVRADIATCAAMDLKQLMTSVVYNANYESLKANLRPQVKDKMEQFSAFLADHPWFAGQNVTYADFIIYESLIAASKMEPGLIESHSNLVKFMDKFEKLPKIDAYVKTEKHRKMPFNDKMAKWGNE